MKLDIVSHHLPAVEGSAAGRVLFATATGLRTAGHDVRVWSWGRDDRPPVPLPDWCSWTPLAPESRFRNRARSLIRPRDETSRLDIHPRRDAIVVADEPLSFGAVRTQHPSVATVHYLTRIDARALGSRRPHDIQTARAERRVAAGADVLLVYSDRLRSALGRGQSIPVAVPIPDEVPEFPDDPVAALIGNWAWRPNQVAFERLVSAWPSIRARVPSARLILAGRHHHGPPSLPEGVTWLGEVPRASDVLADAALLAFPCPDTSGPKVKVLEALAHGRPVVTSRAGAEGARVASEDGLVTTDFENFADAVADLLADRAAAREFGERARAAVAREHAPPAAARARVDALHRALGA